MRGRSPHANFEWSVPDSTAKEAGMGSAQTAAKELRTETHQDPYWLEPGEGDARWVMGELDAIKATAAQTGGLFGLKESKAQRGSGPPLRVHEHEDEACYVLEGEVTFFVGDDVFAAAAGAWVYLPRRIPHSVRVDSAEARTLWLAVPGGFLSFFEIFPTAAQDGGPSGESPDFELMAEAAARYGVTILGPTPDHNQ
jgi:quercetin dioxygenase-like cupin family protein